MRKRLVDEVHHSVETTERDWINVEALAEVELTSEIVSNPIEAALLPKGAILVNVARGALVVTEDMIAALESGHLGGAAVDVTDPEPLPPTSRLWDLPNVIITPHVGGQAATRLDDVTNFFCENLRRYQAGERLINLVDKRLGFPMPEELQSEFVCVFPPRGA